MDRRGFFKFVAGLFAGAVIAPAVKATAPAAFVALDLGCADLGGIMIAPILFQDSLIAYPILHGEIFPFISVTKRGRFDVVIGETSFACCGFDGDVRDVGDRGAADRLD